MSLHTVGSLSKINTMSTKETVNNKRLKLAKQQLNLQFLSVAVVARLQLEMPHVS